MKTILLIILALIGGHLYAQKAGNDIVYLNNGSVIKGTAMYGADSAKISIEISGGSILVYSAQDVSKVEKKKVSVRYRNKGFGNITSAGITFGKYSYYNNVSFSAKTVNGYIWNPYLFTGIGLGLDVYNDIALMPLFFQAQFQMINKRSSPFFSMSIGRGNDWLEDSRYENYFVYEFSGKTMIHPEFGIVRHSGETAYAVSVGYKTQNTYVKSQPWEGGRLTETVKQYRRLTFQMSLMF